jgi:hypothetical protein
VTSRPIVTDIDTDRIPVPGGDPNGDVIEWSRRATTSREDVIALLQVANVKGAQVKEQLTEARADFAATRARRDPDWWRRANAACRYLGRLQQQLQVIIGQKGENAKLVRIAKSNAESYTFDQRFKLAAREVLTGEQYQAVVDRANRDAPR